MDQVQPNVPIGLIGLVDGPGELAIMRGGTISATMTDTPSPRPSREPRTYELRDAEWVEDATPRLRRPPLWAKFAVVLAALTGLVLVTFAAIAGLATLALMRLRAGVLRLFGR